MPFNADTYPFPREWSPSLMREVDIKFCWTVDNIAFRPIQEDAENHWFTSHTLERKIDVPAVLVK